MIRLRALAITVLLAGLCNAVSAAPVTSLPVEKYRLANGLEVILLEQRNMPVVAVNIWYHVGPANEAPGLTGFAHLFEHMMFAGSKHVPRGQADKLLEGAGGVDSNGTTDFDRTNYYDTVPSNQLELALWIHADRMGYLLDVLDQTALSNQQDVVRNERRETVENQPYGIVQERLYQALFPKGHPYHGVVIGSHADIQNARLKDVRDFFSRYYGPNNATIVIAGDIDKARVKVLVEKYFGSFKRGPEVVRPQLALPVIRSEKRLVVKDRVELPRVMMAWLTAPAFTPGDAELSVAAQILGGGKSSRLYKALVYDRQIAQDVSASQASYQLGSVFSLDVTARSGITAQQVEAAMDAELESLRSNPPSEKELERARNTLETAMLLSIEKLGGDGLANQLNQYNHYLGDPTYLGRDLERLRAVSGAGVQRAIQEFLGRQARVVVHGVPGKPELGPEVRATKVPLRDGRAPSGNAEEAWRQSAPAAGPAPAITIPQGQSFTLPNGLTVIHHQNDAVPMVSAALVVRAGSGANPLERPGLSGFTAQMLQEGTTSRSALQVADDIAQLGARLDVNSSADASRAMVVALKDKAGAAMEILADIVQRPAFPEAEIERQRADRLGEITQQLDDAPTVASMVSAAALFGPRHPYGYPELGSRTAVQATTRADLSGFWQQHYRPHNAALVLTGDLSREEAEQLAHTHFGAWQGASLPAAAAAPSAAVPAAARVIVVDKPGAPQTALRMTGPGMARTSPDYPAFEVMNAAFGGLFTSRLNNRLREQKGYTYGMFSWQVPRRQAGYVVLAGSVRTDVTGAAVVETLNEVKGMLARDLPAQELDFARNSQVLSLPGLFDTNQTIAESLAGTFVYGLPLDYYSTLPAQFAAVDAHQVREMAQRYLDPAQLKLIAVGDRKKIVPQLARLKLGKTELRDPEGRPVQARLAKRAVDK
jgi:zinc protease